MLSGGDRRSIAKSNRVRALLQKDPNLISNLAGLANDPDGLVSMRAMDLLEKLAHEHADWVQPHKRLFIGPLADSDQWKIRLQVVRALPLLQWTSRERRRVLEIRRPQYARCDDARRQRPGLQGRWPDGGVQSRHRIAKDPTSYLGINADYRSHPSPSTRCSGPTSSSAPTASTSTMSRSGTRNPQSDAEAGFDTEITTGC
jgi:hypothetical protein